ncbi:hypothetical protein PhCBS80983_g06013 [Powellomyces hirtus]|uniref:CH-like domain-containing protein n=1 Tax=Powellomyces hirtus TaxID=109895 RepID=A0A507DSI4_9FUNG|nr:hypothetical protein PhCBS80983_g06013 [Powellomyces hirtus]
MSSSLHPHQHPLPREILKWLQSLDLTYPVKNPRRDLANGYTIAEIFARYHAGDSLLALERMYTGDSTAQKAKNWEQLGKFFKRHRIHIPEEAAHAVMTAQPDAGVRFITNMYTLLTQKWIKPVRDETTDVSRVPHFALPTTGTLVRGVDGGSAKAQVIVDAHKEYIRQLRVQRMADGTDPRPSGNPHIPRHGDDELLQQQQHAKMHASRATHAMHQRPHHVAGETGAKRGETVMPVPGGFRIGSAGMEGGALMIQVHQNMA